MSRTAELVSEMNGDTAVHRLDQLVTTVAKRLMTADISSSIEVSQCALTYLLDQLSVDASFIRHNDHDMRATKLMAHWLSHLAVPNSNPIGCCVFRRRRLALRDSREPQKPMAIRSEPANLKTISNVFTRPLPFLQFPWCACRCDSETPLPKCWGSSNTGTETGAR